MAGMGVPAAGHRSVRHYVLPDETVMLAVRHHWAMVLEPAATAFGVFVVVFWLVNESANVVGEAADWLWWLWAIAMGRLGWCLWEWRTEWFVATDKRMLLLHGLITRKVAMMPLGKVTDMSYSRSPMGRVLGYGEFLLESAGQDQAMRTISWVAHPDVTYRELCGTIFKPPAPVVVTAPPPSPPRIPPRQPVDRPAWPGIGDTQPIWVGTSAGRPLTGGHEERSWEISEPSSTFIPIGEHGREHPRKMPQAPPRMARPDDPAGPI